MVVLKSKVIMAVCSALLFILLIVAVTTVDVAPVGPADTSVGLSTVNESFRYMIGTSDSWYKISKYLGYAALATAACFALLGLYQLVNRGLKGVDPSLFVLCGLYAVVALLYVFFNKVAVNYRPVLEAGQTVPESSFPSTHTMLACTIFGSTFMVLPRFVKNDGLLRVLRVLCIVALVLTVFARLLSGVHWVTDILGGLLISMALLAVTAALLKKYPSEAEADPE